MSRSSASDLSLSGDDPSGNVLSGSSLGMERSEY